MTDDANKDSKDQPKRTRPAPEPEKTQTASEGLPSDTVAEPSIQALHDAVKVEQEQGFRGTAADPTPNDHYTVAGVLDDSKRVPEEYKTQTGTIVYPADVVGENSK
jgi:hypothetical protein